MNIPDCFAEPARQSARISLALAALLAVLLAPAAAWAQSTPYFDDSKLPDELRNAQVRVGETLEIDVIAPGFVNLDTNDSFTVEAVVPGTSTASTIVTATTANPLVSYVGRSTGSAHVIIKLFNSSSTLIATYPDPDSLSDAVLSVAVSPANNKPTVVGTGVPSQTLSDPAVSQVPVLVDLSDYFEDDGGTLYYSVLSNSAPEVVTPTIFYGSPQLSLAAQSSGTATLQLLISDSSREAAGTQASREIDPDPDRSITHSLTVTVNSRPVITSAVLNGPSIDAAATLTVPEGTDTTTLQLQSTALDSNAGDVLTYNWTTVSKAPCASLTLTGANAATLSLPSIAAGTTGCWEFALVVNDGTDDSLPAQVRLNIAGLAFASAIAPMPIQVTGSAIAPLTLPALSVGVGSNPITYSLSGTFDPDDPNGPDNTVAGNISVSSGSILQPDGSTASGLSFDDSTRILSGTPAVAGIYSLTYTANIAAVSVSETASLTLNVVASTGDTSPTTYRDEAPTFRGADNLNLIYLNNTSLEQQSPLLAASGGNGELTYSLTGLPVGLRFDAATRTIYGTAVGLGLYSLAYTVSDSDSNTAATDTAVLGVTVQIVEPELSATHSNLLHQYTRTLVADINEAVSARVEEVSVSGGDDFSASSSSLLVPIGKTSVWGRSSYYNLSDTTATLNWSGTVRSSYYAVDNRFAGRSLMGVLLSSVDGEFKYNDNAYIDRIDYGNREVNHLGTYHNKMESIHPYLSVANDRFSLWLAAGLGEGSVHRDKKPGTQSDATLNSSVFGFSAALANGKTKFKIISDIVSGRLSLAGSSSLPEMVLESERSRTMMQLLRQYQSGGGLIVPSLEFGTRTEEGGDVLREGTEVAINLRYTHPAYGWSIEFGGAALEGDAEYTEESWHLRVQYAPSADALGLAFSLSPSVGNSAAGTGRVWQQDIEDLTSGAATDQQQRMQGQISYGLELPGSRRLLVPYARINWSEEQGEHLQLGSRLELGQSVALGLVGEEYSPYSGSQNEQRLRLHGQLRF